MKRFFSPHLKTRRMTHDVAPSLVLHEIIQLAQSGLIPGVPMPTTWAAKPAAGNVPGMTIRVTDYGVSSVGSLFISDGTQWRPVNGRVSLAQRTGTIAAPINTQAVAPGAVKFFTLPAQIKIPADMLVPHGRVYVECGFSRQATGGTPAVNVVGCTIGGGNNISDPAIIGNGLPAASGSVLRSFGFTTIQPSGANGLMTAFVGPAQSANTNGYIDRPFNTAIDNYINFYISADAADTSTMALIHYNVWLEA